MAKVSPLTTGQRRALAGLKRAGLLEGVYLAGGAAISHHLRHRVSNDLDLFALKRGLDLEAIRHRALRDVAAETVSHSDATLKLRIANAMVDIVNYPYEPLGRLTRGPEGVRVASLRDLATMKLAAIAKRGVRRDYWDLHEILTQTRQTLRTACDDYLKKFGVSEADLYHVLRALTWFEDAEADPTPPRGLTRGRWKKIRAWFEIHASQELLRRTGK